MTKIDTNLKVDKEVKKELRGLGYESNQLSKHSKVCTEEQAMADAYTLRTLPTLAPWIQFCGYEEDHDFNEDNGLDDDIIELLAID
ncbi:hypothetical protein RB653_010015 [Dictyostelium firmibasis]|uniref:Uncharacterized protein n=1 Tax=Dictyostelium firmibasis TaxID=79012 RepID=A0AAN7YTD8_9MYCE